MMIKKILVALLGMMILVGCSGDDDCDVVHPLKVVGHWMASHHHHSSFCDTTDMWDFTFNADGTGCGPSSMESFRYTVNDNRVTLSLMNTESYFGQTVYVFEVVSISKDRMEWTEISDNPLIDHNLILKFYRK